MSLSLASPQPAAVAMPPAPPTSYRYWEDYRADELRAVLEKIALVIDDKQRQLDRIFPGNPVPSAVASGYRPSR